MNNEETCQKIIKEVFNVEPKAVRDDVRKSIEAMEKRIKELNECLHDDYKLLTHLINLTADPKFRQPAASSVSQ